MYQYLIYIDSLVFFFYYNYYHYYYSYCARCLFPYFREPWKYINCDGYIVSFSVDAERHGNKEATRARRRGLAGLAGLGLRLKVGTHKSFFSKNCPG